MDEPILKGNSKDDSDPNNIASGNHTNKPADRANEEVQRNINAVIIDNIKVGG